MERNELLDQWKEPVAVLDHGLVRLVDVMGDDAAIVQAARVSYGKGTKTVREDRGLIRYLVSHRHTSPLEMCEIKLHCKMPIFVARQWIRHRTANVNEVSGRYSVLPDEMYVPDPFAISLQSANNKQGRAEGKVDDSLADEFLQMLEEAQRSARETYEDSLELGIARELSRINLPVSQYTEWYWKIDLKNLLNFLNLRLDSHAQYEIRVYALAIAQIVKSWVPLVWEAFEDFELHAVTFSAPEQELLFQLIGCLINGKSPESFDHRLSKREVEDLQSKTEAIGINLSPYKEQLLTRVAT